MKLQNLSVRQVAIGVPALGLLDWAFLQFIALPNMTDRQRSLLYSVWDSKPYLNVIILTFVGFAIWFVFFYRGPFITQGRRIAVFGMALGAVCGMLMIFIIRLTWHI